MSIFFGICFLVLLILFIIGIVEDMTAVVIIAAIFMVIVGFAFMDTVVKDNIKLEVGHTWIKIESDPFNAREAITIVEEKEGWYLITNGTPGNKESIKADNLKNRLIAYKEVLELEKK